MADRLFDYPKTLPLHIFILTPLVLPILVVMGLTGSLSLRSDRQLIEDLVFQWMTEVGDRVEVKLTVDLAFPQQILNSYQETFFDNPNTLSAQDIMWPFVQNFNIIQGIYLGSDKEGELLATFRDRSGMPIVQIANSETDNRLVSYTLDDRGELEEAIERSVDAYDVRSQPWYNNTLRQDKITLNIFDSQLHNSVLHGQIARPIYNDLQEPIGVGRIDFTLDSFSTYLKQLDLEFSAQILILDSPDNILATSTFTRDRPEQIHSELLQEVQPYLNTNQASTPQSITQNRKNYWILTIPYILSQDHQLWIVMVVPEQQVLQSFNLHFRNYLLLNLAGLCVAIALGALAINQAVSILNYLSEHSEKVINGKPNDSLAKHSIIYELQRLINSIKNITQYWLKVINNLDDQNDRLAEKVAAGTNLLIEAVEKADIANLKLQQSQSLLSSVINSSMDGIMALESVRDDREKIVDFRWIVSNQIICHFFHLELRELVGKYWLDQIKNPNLVSLFDHYVNVVETGRNLELEFPYDYGEDRFWFHIIAVKLGDGLSVNFRDITDRKKSVFELRKMLDEVHQLANTDGLTKVANRRQFDECLYQEWLRLQRDRLPLSLVLCDVDYFKRYNDTYGHQAGDDCLIQVARAIQHSVRRTSDLVARYGGEEFVILLPNTSEEGAKVVAQLIQSQVENLKIAHKTSDVSSSVTISLGVATLIPSLEISKDSLVALADEALYEAKQQGRNRFVVKS